MCAKFFKLKNKTNIIKYNYILSYELSVFYFIKVNISPPTHDLSLKSYNFTT